MMRWSNHHGRSTQEIVGFVMHAVAILGRFVLLVVLARSYAPGSVGVYGLVTATVALSLYLVGLDYHTFTTREGIRTPSHWPALVREHAQVNIRAYGLAILPIVGIGLTNILTWDLVAWCLVLILTDHISLEIHRLLVARKRAIDAHIVYAIRAGSWAYAWSIWALMARPPLWTLWMVWIIGGLIAGAYGVWRERHLLLLARHATTDRSRRRTGLRVALMLLASTLALRAALSIDRYLLAAFTDIAEVGIYTFHASATVAILILTEAAVVVSALPYLLSAQEGPVSELRLLQRHFQRRLLLVGTGTAAMLVFAAPTIYALVDPAYRQHWQVGIWLVAAQLVGIAGLGLHYRLYSERRDRIILMASITGLGVTVAADLVMIPSYGAEGAAAGTFIAFTSMNLVRLWQVSRFDRTLSEH